MAATRQPAQAPRIPQTRPDFQSRTPCVFYNQGRCAKGVNCTFLHQGTPRAGAMSGAPSSINGGPSSPTRLEARSKIPCKYFASGSCRNYSNCHFSHQETTEVPSLASEHASLAVSDSRAQVLCAFFVSGSCKNGEGCSWSHAQRERIGKTSEEDVGESMTREICGARVLFGGGAKVVKISVPSDFSAVCISRLPPESTPRSITQLLSRAYLTVPTTSVRMMPQSDDMYGRTATIQVEDPSFADRLCRRLGPSRNFPGAEHITATRINITLPQTQGASSRRIDCKKVHCSWHKPTKTAWLNFGNENIAQKVKDRYSSGVYKVLDQNVKCIGPSRGGGPFNPLAWTVTLTDLDPAATESSIQQRVPLDIRPRHVELGKPSYNEPPDLALAKVKSLFTAIGPLEAWEDGAGAEGKRIKATARFQDENDARRAAESLDGGPLPFSKTARLTAQLVFTARLKVSDRIYGAVRPEIKAQKQIWKSQHVLFIPYPPARGYRVLKLEGENNKSVADAKGALEGMLAGEVALHDGNPIWTASFGLSGISQEKLKEMETRLGVVIERNKRRSRIHLYGAPEKRREAVRQLADLATEETSTARHIDLTASGFNWACRGGFKTISSVLGEGIVAIDITSNPRRILVNGSDDNYRRALRMISDQGDTEKQQDHPTAAPEDCAICWTEAEAPVGTPCGHTYCAGCFEAFCFNSPVGASEFCIRCEGATGACKAELAFEELRELLSSGTFEDLLEASFASHIKRHPDDFRVCQTPDCDQVYRVTTTPGTFTCTRCLESTCTKCNERHPGVSCDEHFRASDPQVLEDAKKRLGIKDCPKCKTSIEKTEGCNHMTCVGCRTHICWICLETYKEAGQCYDHLTMEHGGCFD